MVYGTQQYTGAGALAVVLFAAAENRRADIIQDCVAVTGYVLQDRYPALGVSYGVQNGSPLEHSGAWPVDP